MLSTYATCRQFTSLQEELMNGFKNKQPKIIAACTEALSTALKQFGAKVINIKLLVKAMPPLFDHRDKAVREAAKGLAVEMYRWLGPALKPTLEGALKPVQVSYGQHVRMYVRSKQHALVCTYVRTYVRMYTLCNLHTYLRNLAHSCTYVCTYVLYVCMWCR